MNREQAKEYVKQSDNFLYFLKQRYNLDFGINNKKNVNCILPGHTDNNASMSYKEEKGIVSCFGCGRLNLDIFSFIQAMENVSQEESFKIAYNFFNIELEEEQKEHKHFKSKAEKKEYEEQQKKRQAEVEKRLNELKKKKEEQQKQETEKEKKQVEVYKQLFEKAKANREKAIEYLISRAINKEYANKLDNIGAYTLTSGIATKILAPKDKYLSKNQNENEIVIIKVKDNFYIQRFVNRRTTDNNKYMNATGLHSTIYNEDSFLNNNDFVFVVEGIFDCLSIESIGKKAIALNSTSNARMLIEYLKANRDKISKDLRVILLCDNDTKSGTGARTNEYLLNELKDLNIKAYIKTEILQKESVKDMNELLLKGQDTAKKAIESAIKEVKAEEKEKQENFSIEYKKDESKIIIKNDFETIIEHQSRIEQPQREHITTGFKQLDKAVNKGLTTGLYVIGAKAGTGKTAFILQVSDYIAKTQKKKVLFFSLEQGKNALFNRRISRITLENIIEKHNGNKTKINEDLINTAEFKDIEFFGEQYEQNKERDNNIFKAIHTFGTYAKNVFTIDDIYSVEDIKKVIMSCIQQNNGEKPIVFIDYLQRLKPNNNNDSFAKYEDKRLFDICIQELKDLIKKESLIVFLVSSLNRQGKETELNAYSGSNEIEFNAEFAGTLQIDKAYYKNKLNIGNKLDDETKKELIRKKIQDELRETQTKRLKLCILKQKDGISGIDIALRLYAKNYYFEEVEEDSNERPDNSNLLDPKKKSY